MKMFPTIVCSAAMTFTGLSVDLAPALASSIKPIALEMPSLLHQIGGRRGFYGGRSYYRPRLYRGGGPYGGGYYGRGTYRGGYYGRGVYGGAHYGGYYGRGYGNYSDIWVPGAALVAGALIGAVIADQWEPEYRPVYRPRYVYRPYSVYDYPYRPCTSLRQQCD